MQSDSIDRRAALGRLAAAGAAAAGAVAIPRVVGRTGTAAEMSVTILLNEPIGTIKPAIYSQFAEHIGGVIYDGIWVGTDSKVANVDGIRAKLIEHVKQLGHVVVRWPGGCFADKYHWRDGIGPRAARPRRFGRWRDDTEPNHFGTHEFIEFCKLCEVEPYLAANVGTGSPEEFQQWVEYCNAPAGSTSLADERAANGAREPFRVRYWGVGNESWGCGGNFIPEDYCREYRKFTEWLPKYGVPLYLIAAGPNGNDRDWTQRFFAKWRDGQRASIQGWAPHYYCGTTGHALNFNQDQWYEQLHKANRMETLITDQWACSGRSRHQARGQARDRRMGKLASRGDRDQQATSLSSRWARCATPWWRHCRSTRSIATPRKSTWPTWRSSSTTCTRCSWPTATSSSPRRRFMFTRCIARITEPGRSG